jgi:hypothetical protein
MPDAGGGRRLPEEPPLGIVGLFAEQLEGDGAPEAQVLREEDLPEPAGSEAPYEAKLLE